MMILLLVLPALWLLFACVAGEVSVPVVVDVSPLLLDRFSAEARAVARVIDLALREQGLVIVTGLGDELSFAKESLQAAKTLFTLQANVKAEVAIKNTAESFGRGYLGFGDESGVASNFEPKEGYSYGATHGDEATGGNLLSTPNLWPKSANAGTVRALEAVYHRGVDVAKAIVAGLSSQFDCGRQGGGPTLEDVAQGGERISLMRLFHYFNMQSTEVQEHLSRTAASSAGAKRLLGSSPHTDWGFLTLILADDVGGLQFLRRGGDVHSEGDWVDVPHIPGSLVVNGGDYLSLITKGVYHSPVHRVLTPGSPPRKTADDGEGSASTGGAVGGRDRYSFVLFFYPAYSSLVSNTVLGHCLHTFHHADSAATAAGAGVRIDPSTGTASAGDATGEGAAVAARAEPGPLGYNTLLRLEDNGTGAEAALHSDPPVYAFGDYVIKKWQGVYRAV
jgi:isopenicillin N synthase-like dioxygenase